jgi:ABC-type Fe3+/spermidine/putrescine transport system ATPase subunit
MGHANIIPVAEYDASRRVVRAGGITLAVAAAPNQGMAVVIRPESLTLASARGPDVQGRIVSETYMGASIHYNVELIDGGKLSVLYPNRKADHTLRVGDTVTIDVASDGYHLVSA